MNDTNPAGTLARFLTLADTAEVLNVSASQAYALVRSGELPAIKVGGRGQWRVERSVLESYIEAKYEESRRLQPVEPVRLREPAGTARRPRRRPAAVAPPHPHHAGRRRSEQHEQDLIQRDHPVGEHGGVPPGDARIVHGEVEVVPADPVDGAVLVAVGKVHADLAAAAAQVPQHEAEAEPARDPGFGVARRGHRQALLHLRAA